MDMVFHWTAKWKPDFTNLARAQVITFSVACFRSEAWQPAICGWQWPQCPPSCICYPLSINQTITVP